MPAVEHAVLPPAYETRDGKLVPYIRADAVERRLAELRASTTTPAPAPAPPPSAERELSAAEGLVQAALDLADADAHSGDTDDATIARSLDALFPAE